MKLSNLLCNCENLVEMFLFMWFDVTPSMSIILLTQDLLGNMIDNAVNYLTERC